MRIWYHPSLWTRLLLLCMVSQASVVTLSQLPCHFARTPQVCILIKLGLRTCVHVPVNLQSLCFLTSRHTHHKSVSEKKHARRKPELQVYGYVLGSLRVPTLQSTATSRMYVIVVDSATSPMQAPEASGHSVNEQHYTTFKKRAVQNSTSNAMREATAV